jgi:hypothetical protein
MAKVNASSVEMSRESHIRPTFNTIVTISDTAGDAFCDFGRDGSSG